MTSQLRYVLPLVVWLFFSIDAFGQPAPADVHARLTLADGRTTYRVGEPIQIVLEFTADRDGYEADTIPDGTEPTSDRIRVSPDSGVTHWLDELLGGGRGFRDVSSEVRLSQAPTRVPFFLNDSIRFDRPGHYSVKVTSSRVRPTSTLGATPSHIVLTTNEVGFEIEPMNDADEEKEVNRLSEALGTARGWQAQEKIGRELAYLTGDPSTREKLRRFLNADERAGNFNAQIYHGLFVARNRALVLQTLEAAMRDPNTPVTWSLLGTTAKIRELRESAGLPPPKPTVAGAFELSPDPRANEIEMAYVTELAASLAKRVGKSQTTTAMTILMHLPRDTQPNAPVLQEVRRILVQQFDSLHPFSQESLLRQYWDQLKDASLVPSLKKMLRNSDLESRMVHGPALQRLIEIAPDEARPYVIAEIHNPQSPIDLEILGSLDDKYLPEVDQSLLEQIRRLTVSKTNVDRVLLKHKASLAARYATEAIYADLMDVYKTAGDALPIETRAGFLAYFVRHNEPEGLSLIEETLANLAPGGDFTVLPDLTKLFYSDAIDALLRKRLESDEPQTASTAAYLISLHGPASDQKAIEARLDRWRRDWTERRAEADTNLQGRIESELISAMTRAKSWTLSPERVKQLKQSCITQICRQNFPVQ